MEKIHLEAGLPILVEVAGRTSLDTRVVGFETGNYIIVKHTNDRGSEIEVGNSCNAKLIHEGVIYTFGAEVLATLTSPSPLIFLKYPPRIDMVQLRKDRRYSVNIPAVFHDNTQKFMINVTAVKDISMQGCRLSIPEAAKNPTVKVGDSCKVSFIVMHKYFEAQGLVKNIYEGAAATLMGLEFSSMKDICRELLEGMINILEAQGGSSRDN
jgi:c-di-GMP-binding flagellar brake protein YcgR